MKILTENNIDDVVGNSLTSFMGSNEIHGPVNMLDDYPTVQWVGGFPKTIEYDSILKRQKITNELIITGYGSMNGIYLGNFNGDELTYKIYEWITSTSGPSYGSWACLNQTDSTTGAYIPANVPVNIYKSFGHFVRGRPSSYDDYLSTLENLQMVKDYFSTNFKVEAQISSHINQLTNIDEDGNVIRADWGHVFFHIESISKYSFDNSSQYADGDGRKYWKVKGTFQQETTNNILEIDDDHFHEELEVGMTLMLETENSDGTKVSRIAQILQIRGKGAKEKSVTMVIRSFESTGVEDDLESLLDPSKSIVTFLNDFFDKSLRFKVTYLFNSMRIGLLRAGYIEQFPNPQVGMTRSYRDYSKKTETLDGGHHAVNRNIAKIYNGKLILDRDRVRRFLSFSENQRAKPFPIEVLSSMEKETPTVFYGFFASTPTESFSFRTGEVRDIDFTIQQVF